MATDPAERPSEHGSKYRFLITPKWIGFHVLVAVAVVAMVNLGFWQLRRLDERRDFNSTVRANANQPVAAFDDLRPDIVTPSAVEWRRVRVTGTYVRDHEFFVVNRSQNGATGRNVVDALQLDDGALLLVNRGFAPEGDDVPPIPSGPVALTGRLRASERRTPGQVSDQSADGLTEIRRIDIDVLASQFNSFVLPMYVEQLDSIAPLQPIVAPTLDEGPHLSYTIQWFIFSVFVIVGWVLAVRRSIAVRSGKVVQKRRSSYIPIADDPPT